MTDVIHLHFSPSPATPAVDDSPTTARERFGTQKAISSDMFFERGAYDPGSVSEGRTRLAQFQGATSISSNQYFGREEQEVLEQGADGGLLGDGSLAGLETAARDAVSRIIANQDVQNLGESIRSGALKVCRASSHGAGITEHLTALAFRLALRLSSTDVRALAGSGEALAIRTFCIFAHMGGTMLRVLLRFCVG